MHVYVVDNADWFVARDAADALDQWAKLYGEQGSNGVVHITTNGGEARFEELSNEPALAAGNRREAAARTKGA